MDNLAHTLCGTALARARLVPPGRLAALTLVVAANAPDVDAIYYLMGDDTGAMLHRRGWTHCLLGFTIEIPVLAALMRFAGGRFSRARATPRWRPLLIASTVGYLSHLLLDLLNTYGVRFLLPFSERWFRGDTAFIVDPWMWLLFGAATLFGGAVRAWGWMLWVGFIALGAWAMTQRSVPAATPWVWGGAMCAAALARAAQSTPRTAIARALVVLVALYLVGLKGMSMRARERGLAALRAESGLSLDGAESTVNPALSVPWNSTVVVATRDEIFRVSVSLPHAELDRVVFRMPRNLDDPALEEVTGTREYRAWRRFARHPFVRREGEQLVLGDGRYSTGSAGDWSNSALPLPSPSSP